MILIFDIKRSITGIRGRSGIHGTNWREWLKRLTLLGEAATRSHCACRLGMSRVSIGLVLPRYTDRKYRLLVVWPYYQGTKLVYAKSNRPDHDRYLTSDNCYLFSSSQRSLFPGVLVLHSPLLGKVMSVNVW